MTYYFDSKTKPPSGPEDDEHEGAPEREAHARL